MIGKLNSISIGLAIASLALLFLVSPSRAQFDPLDDNRGGGFLQGGFSLGDGGNAKVSVDAQFTAPDGDKPARLFVTATIEKGWHIYSTTQSPGGPLASKITVAEDPDKFRITGNFKVFPPPERKYEEVFDMMVESHHGTVTWYAPIELGEGVERKTLRISGELSAQLCDANACLPPQGFGFTASLGKGVEIPSEGVAEAGASQIAPWEQTKIKSVWFAIWLAFIGGILLNLMPCVLPVIGLKLLSFVEQAGHSRRHAFMLNVWYSAGLVSVFLVLASLAAGLGVGWGELFSYSSFNVVMAAVVFVMALSFLGVWEIPIPGFIGSGKMAEAGEKEGVAGAFTKGAITTILATPCTGPFMASAVAWAIRQPPSTIYAVFISMGLGMASPYLLVGAFPELIRFIPKPGAWMDTFKQIMGFVLLGTVVYIFTYLHWTYMVPTMGLLFSLWAACWWINRTPITAAFVDRLRTWLEAATFSLIMWILMFPGTDNIFAGRYSFGGLHDVMVARYLAPGFELLEFEQARADGKTVIVDFTADWCPTCKVMEKFVLDTPEIQKVIEADGMVFMTADWTHRDEQVTRLMKKLGAKQVPILAIFPADRPNEPFVLRGTYTQQTLLDLLEKAGPSKGVEQGQETPGETYIHPEGGAESGATWTILFAGTGPPIEPIIPPPR